MLRDINGSRGFTQPFDQMQRFSELTVAVLPRSGEIVLTEMSQRFHIDHLGRVMDAALQGCQVVPT